MINRNDILKQMEQMLKEHKHDGEPIELTDGQEGGWSLSVGPECQYLIDAICEEVNRELRSWKSNELRAVIAIAGEHDTT